MVYLMRLNLSSNFLHLTPLFPHHFEQGGLAQVVSLRGGSKTRFALSCLGAPKKPALVDPPHLLTSHHSTLHLPSPPREEQQPLPYAIFIADNGSLYPPSLHHHWEIPLSQLLLVTVKNPLEVWKVGLEAIQTGLFAWALLRPSQACPSYFLRKFQLAAEQTKSKVLLLCNAKLPHWTLKASFEVSGHADSLSSKSIHPKQLQRSLPFTHTQDRHLSGQ